MRKRGIAIALAVAVLPAAAAENPFSNAGPGGVAAPRDSRLVDPPRDRTVITVTKRDCARVVRHQPAADVAYQPGVDARGRAVAPADLNPQLAIKVPDVIEFDVTRDLSSFMGAGARQSQAQQAALIAAQKAQEAAAAAGTTAGDAVSLASDLKVAVAIEDAVDAVAAATEIRDAAQDRLAQFPGTDLLQSQFDAAQAGLTSSQDALTAAQAAFAGGDSSAALTQAAEAVQAAAGIGADVTSGNSVGNAASGTAASAAATAVQAATTADASASATTKAAQAASVAGSAENVAANAAVAAAEQAFAGTRLAVDAAQAALNAAPADPTLRADLLQARTALQTAEVSLSAAQSAAATGNAAIALTQAQAAVDAAAGIGFVEEADFTALREAAATLLGSATDTAGVADAAAAASGDADVAYERVARMPEATINLGKVRYDINSGDITFNGQPISGDQEAQLRAACLQRLRGGN